MPLYAQPQASPASNADQVEGPSIEDVNELCDEFRFLEDYTREEGLEKLQQAITAAITRCRAPVAEPETTQDTEVDWKSMEVRMAFGMAKPSKPAPVNLAELRDPDFSDGLSPSQHLDVVHGGSDPRLIVETHEAYPAPLTIEPCQKPHFEFDRSVSVLDDRTPEEICGYGDDGLCSH